MSKTSTLAPQPHGALAEIEQRFPGTVLLSPEEIGKASFDGMKLRGQLTAVFRPSEAEAVGHILRAAQATGTAVTTRGTGSNLTGAATPIQGGWVLDLSRLSRFSIDPVQRLGYAGAGTIVAEFQEAAEKAGLFYPPDPSSRKFCTIGGNIACNAGGMRCVKYGVTRDYVVSLEGFFASGEPFEFGKPLRKFAAGFNLRDLMVGSEGLLGVITGATLRLVPKPATSWSFLAGFATEERALEAVLDALRRGLSPCILEFLDEPSVQGAEKATGQALFADCPGRSLLLIQIDGHPAAVAEECTLARNWLKEWSEAFWETGDPVAAERLWVIRRACSSAMFELGDSKLNEDVVVPLQRQADLIRTVHRLRQEYAVAIGVFGHAGDGNLHVNIMHNRDDTDNCHRARQALGVLMNEVVAMGGAISGEHGIGLAKSPFFPLQISSAVQSAMLAVKKALDPAGILNPGKIFTPYEVWDKPREVHRFPWDHR